MNDPIDPLAKVLAQLVDDAGFALLVDADSTTEAFCVHQYNRVLARIKALEPDLTAEFKDLDEHAGAGAVRMRARDLLVQLKSSRPHNWMADLFEGFFEHHRHNADS